MSMEIRSLPAGRGVDWIRASWAMFKQAAGVWIGILIVYVLIAAASSLIPLVGSLAMNLFAPVLTVGICLGCRSLDSGEPLRLGHLFEAFKGDRLGPLIVVGVLSIVGVLIVAVIAMALIGGSVMVGASDQGDPSSLGLVGLLAVLLVLALAVPLAMALWFAAPLVGLDGLAPVEALKLSFRGCLTNFVPLLVWGLLAFLLMIAASIPLLLGWLVVMPMLMAAYYRMYVDIFAAAPTAA